MPGEDVFKWVALFALSAMLVNSIGILLVYKKTDLALRGKEYLMCFAAGVLIASVLSMGFPEAVAKNPQAGLAALTGFIFMFFSNKFIKMKTKQTEVAFGITAIEGIGIHSFIDGIIYSVTFSVSQITGIISGVGLIAHEFAEGVIAYAVLLKGGMERKRALLFAFLIAALTTPLGAFIAFPIISRLKDEVLGLALGFVAGVLIYLSASHLLPEAREHEKNHSYLAFLFGISLALFIMLTKN
ncbi:MAG: zinc/iron permease [Dehalobacter sp. 4CP]|nr:zinc/iron permease [Dehalobacter sp. 4CP]